MADRPWVTPQDVKTYTDIQAVQARDDSKLAVDIMRAEQYVVTYTHNRFGDCDEIPAAVKTAVILLAEVYASYANTLKETHCGAFKSETFDDYSYSVGDSTFEGIIKTLDLTALLDDYVISQANGGVTMRLRKL
jgi:hypothetical protein